MTWNKTAAAKYARRHAHTVSAGRCGHFVTEAIRNGGKLNIPYTPLAKDMGKTLLNAGFHKIKGLPVVGDIAIIQGIEHHEAGHACIYDGHQWISDFVQREMYPGTGYRGIRPSFEIYRR
ncbi:CHAP domain-containing protein [Lelliottia amnigena]|uniref:CHAP domain-containing protein n=1 Tax=Lelliottia amnigena TaxID=61646 RepID=A0AAP2EY09_LELAM|nr:CHAP domain-containing protein [Lelliottia amnigena]MBL5897516.1 CHAP domain-containing protein [Lelliottia amnigena]MBL5933028.1 CHAP domain-containing protein [Lelliottia amnigena]